MKCIVTSLLLPSLFRIKSRIRSRIIYSPLFPSVPWFLPPLHQSILIKDARKDKEMIMVDFIPAVKLDIVTLFQLCMGASVEGKVRYFDASESSISFDAENRVWSKFLVNRSLIHKFGDLTADNEFDYSNSWDETYRLYHNNCLDFAQYMVKQTTSQYY
jgi:hypothetical protein